MPRSKPCTSVQRRQVEVSYRAAMAPQIQRARAALRAIHRMEALRVERIGQTDEEQPAAGPSSSSEGVEEPLLGRTPEEAVVADRRLVKPPSMLHSIVFDTAIPCCHTITRCFSGSRRSFKNVATDILESHQALARSNSAMQGMSEEEKRAHILGMFRSANSWCMGTGTALPKTTVTSEDTRGPGKLLLLVKQHNGDCHCCSASHS